MKTKKIYRKATQVAAVLGMCIIGSQVATAASRVNVMPDRQVRPGVSIPVFGNAGNLGGIGNGSANFEAYSWSCSANANVGIADDGVLSGTVANDRNIVENMTFNLLNGSTRELVDCTLTVGGTSDTVRVDIVDNADVISSSQLGGLQVNVNVAIQDGLRAMYLTQQPNGRWAFSNTERTCAMTAFSVWAFANSGHTPLNNPDDDIYAEFVQQGIDYILSVSTTPNFVDQLNLGGDGVSATPDSNGNGRIIGLCGDSGYASPVGAAAIIAAYAAAPASPILGATYTGESYFDIVSDAIEWTYNAQYDFNNYRRGGWYYRTNGGADTSIDSWNYVALEGYATAFGGIINDNVISEAERRLISTQVSAGSLADGNYGQCGYATTNPLGNDGNATTAGCVSGLVLSSLDGRIPAILNATAVNVDDRLEAAERHLGLRWEVAGGTWAGNMPNFYAMWTTARALRLANTPKLINGTEVFNWESGEKDSAPGIVPGAGNLEGYFNYLVRTQAADGKWDATVNSSSWPTVFNTATGVLILQPTVFGVSCVDDLNSRAKSGKIQLTWSDTGAALYNVYRSTTAGGPYALLAGTTSTYSTYLDATVSNGTTYHYVVREATSTGVDICTSNETTATPIERRRRARRR